ncbi:MAG: transposase [Candidatus Omnitrophica bacterium]|nr:transposase [Candidatus Omnitrophota bacterium]MBU4303873.1 transposase [Candidatus Omnitrophota bacterium]MBU4468816.1 transposase [Candidatus Omnitrophota bacterium]MCG2708143.1 transposase [Candidatus Omnitrophota bacterium]
MPRTARVLVDQGYYHIVTRGIDCRRLFRYKQDYELFLGIVATYLNKFKVLVMNYCLMPNHVHLLMKAEIASDLPVFMKAILQVYAAKFRRKYKSAGFVFQNRYKSRLIDNDAYLLECARYIERNPVRAKIVVDVTEYPWSSYHYYAKCAADKIIALSNPLYLDMADTDIKRREAYASFIHLQRAYDPIVDKALRIA